MPNRIIREGILSSEKVAKLKAPEEVFYRRLMSVVDDFGRTDANPLLLRSRCYPLQTDQVRAADISRWIAACEKAGLLLGYVVGQGRYIEVLNFGQQRRAEKSKFPHPPTDAIPMLASDNIIPTDAHLGVCGDEDECDTLVNGAAFDPDVFAEFWRLYPRRAGKVPAKKSFVKERCSEHMPAIAVAIEREKRSPQWQRDGGQYIPHPATWINQRRWEDAMDGTLAIPAVETTPRRTWIP